KLAQIAAALSLSEQKGSKTIVALMSRPRRPRGNEDPANIYWHDDPEHLDQLYAYCRQDVVVERELHRKLPPLSQPEQAVWRLDQIINDRGFYTDGELIEKAIAVATAAERAVQAELQQVTGGEIDSTNKVAKLLAWLAARGCNLPDLQKGTLRSALRRK